MIATETEAASKIQVSWAIPVELVRLLESFAEAEGIDAEQLVSRILSLGIQEEDITPAGRCSVRMGLSSMGPSLLPMQQELKINFQSWP